MSITATQLAIKLKHLNELESRLTFRISRMSKLLDMQATKLLSKWQINLTDYRVLLVTRVFGEISSADLSRYMVIDRAQISRTTTSLIANGLIDVKDDPKSKRRKLLNLSAKGFALMEKIGPVTLKRQEVLEELLTKNELDALNSAVHKISNHLAEELDDSEH